MPVYFALQFLFYAQIRKNPYLCGRKPAIIPMETLTSWAKENVQLISLLVGIVGVVVSIISVVYELRKKKKDNRGGAEEND